MHPGTLKAIICLRQHRTIEAHALLEYISVMLRKIP